MGRPKLPHLLVLLTTMTIGVVIDTRASDPEGLLPHIRSDDPQMRALIADATALSPTVRALVERVTDSDVIVYVECDRDPKARGPGRLNFMSASGGVRYLLVRLKPKRLDAAIAALAHELQHAAEIAAIPSIVDERSLAREYERIGYRSHAPPGLGFDTKAAVEIGRHVAAELMALRSSGAD